MTTLYYEYPYKPYTDTKYGSCTIFANLDKEAIYDRIRYGKHSMFFQGHLMFDLLKLTEILGIDRNQLKHNCLPDEDFLTKNGWTTFRGFD